MCKEVSRIFQSHQWFNYGEVMKMTCRTYFFLPFFSDNLDSFSSGAVSEASFLRGEKRSLVSIQVCYTGWLLEYIAIASTAISILLGLFDINIPNIHFLDAVIMSIVIPFIHILNDEITKGIILEHGWIKGISYALGMYIPLKKEKQRIPLNRPIKINKVKTEMPQNMATVQPLTASQIRLLGRRCKSYDDLMTNKDNVICDKRPCLKRHHSLENITLPDPIDDQVVDQLQKPFIVEPKLSDRMYTKPTNSSLASVNSSIITIFLED